MQDLFRSVDLKLARADKQAKSPESCIGVWTSENSMRTKCILRDGRLGFRLVFEGFATPPAVDDWGLLLGECIHNLRSSLDNLAFALARLRRDPPERPNRIAFPIFENGQEFQANGLRTLDQLPGNAAELIERIQPFQRDGSSGIGTPDLDALLHLHQLNNADKHRVPPIALVAPTDIAHSIKVEFESDEDAAANVPPDTTVGVDPLKAGVLLLEYRTTRPVASVNGNFAGSAVVAVQTSTGFAPLGPHLLGINHYTRLVVDQFRHFFEASDMPCDR